MNAGFVNVKVDREERPDVDAIYMEAVQAVTGSGGWPMTVFLLPDGRPFLGGTYFPRDRFVELLGQVSRAWHQRRPDLEAAATQLAEAVRAGTALPGGRGWESDAEPTRARTAGEDRRAPCSGPPRTPSWPVSTPSGAALAGPPSSRSRPCSSCCCWPRFRTGRTDVLDAVTTTLDAMAAGGIYDHLGGGFARYSTDRRWLVPHFEKMLYDNALLARVYLHAWQLTGAVQYRQVVTETLEYLLRSPLRLPGGGLASAEDADSEGEEGRFYVWDEAEVLEVGGPAAPRLVRRHQAGELGGPQHPVPAAPGATATPTRGGGRPGRPSSPAGKGGSGPAWTTRC